MSDIKYFLIGISCLIASMLAASGVVLSFRHLGLPIWLMFLALLAGAFAWWFTFTLIEWLFKKQPRKSRRGSVVPAPMLYTVEYTDTDGRYKVSEPLPYADAFKTAAYTWNTLKLEATIHSVPGTGNSK